jgi:uncharacterized protein (DUF58 family)
MFRGCSVADPGDVEGNPIVRNPGGIQSGVDPSRLKPSRDDLVRARLEFQRLLIRSGVPRVTIIQVSPEGVIVDGHHAVRASAEEGRTVDVRVTPLRVASKPGTILDLPDR